MNEWNEDQVSDWLEAVGGNKSRAALLLGISRPTLDKLLQEGAPKVYALAMQRCMASDFEHLEDRVEQLGRECAEECWSAVSAEDRASLIEGWTSLQGDWDALGELLGRSPEPEWIALMEEAGQERIAELAEEL